MHSCSNFLRIDLPRFTCCAILVTPESNRSDQLKIIKEIESEVFHPQEFYSTRSERPDEKKCDASVELMEERLSGDHARAMFGKVSASSADACVAKVPVQDVQQVDSFYAPEQQNVFPMAHESVCIFTLLDAVCMNLSQP
ncbi:unnamed protein product [Soboliphyme baturini]|uniref:Uncharacterized protein n=1 Tax=Soboliphyme baturini TaxID=241478 RepID=A0A3P8BR46_9BILA|nr:unnamed protein product [Soboliphyme baturini]